jgi:hypothetical protein
MGLFGVKKFAGYTSQSLKEKESADKRLAELEEEKLTGISLILNSTDMIWNWRFIYMYIFSSLVRSLVCFVSYLFLFCVAAAIEDYALALKYKEEIAAIHRNDNTVRHASFSDFDNPFKFPEEFDQDNDPEFLPEWVVKLPVPICWDESGSVLHTYITK